MPDLPEGARCPNCGRGAKAESVLERADLAEKYGRYGPQIRRCKCSRLTAYWPSAFTADSHNVPPVFTGTGNAEPAMPSWTAAVGTEDRLERK